MPRSQRSPKPRRRTRERHAAADPLLLPYLRDREKEDCAVIPFLATYPKSASDWRDAAGEIRREFYERLAAAWPAVRAAVVADWARLNPGQRPACWWLFDWSGELEDLERQRIDPPLMDYNEPFGVEEMGLWRPVRFEAWRRWREASA